MPLSVKESRRYSPLYIMKINPRATATNGKPPTYVIVANVTIRAIACMTVSPKSSGRLLSIPVWYIERSFSEEVGYVE